MAQSYFIKTTKMLCLFLFKLLILSTLYLNNVSAQTKGIIAPIVGLDFDTRLTISPMVGLNWYYLDNNNFPTLIYNQILLRYSIPNNSVGFQANVGISVFFVGIKTGMTYEYSFDFQKSNLSQTALIGLDFLGILSIMGGLNYSYIKGTDSKRMSFAISTTCPIIFSSYNKYKEFKSNQPNKIKK